MMYKTHNEYCCVRNVKITGIATCAIPGTCTIKMKVYAYLQVACLSGLYEGFCVHCNQHTTLQKQKH